MLICPANIADLLHLLGENRCSALTVSCCRFLDLTPNLVRGNQFRKLNNLLALIERSQLRSFGCAKAQHRQENFFYDPHGRVGDGRHKYGAFLSLIIDLERRARLKLRPALLHT